MEAPQTILTSESLSSGVRYGPNSVKVAASPVAISGTFCAGDKPISPRSARHALTMSFSNAILGVGGRIDTLEIRAAEMAGAK